MAGVAAVMHVAPEVLHLIIGDKAGQFAQALLSPAIPAMNRINP
jgi:hypothetical protein